VQTVIVSYYGMMFDQQSEPKSSALWGLAGAIIFGGAWWWALITSLGVYRELHAAQRAKFEARTNEPPELKSPQP
jgi:hypothetical protein